MKRITKALLLAGGAFLLCAAAQAQQLRQMQYWFDDDAGARTSVAATADGLFSLDIDATTLAPGIHTLSVRTQDDSGCWSVPVTHYFTRAVTPRQSRIAGVQYWFNDAYNNATYTALSSEEPTVVFNVNMPVRDLLKRQPTEDDDDDADLYAGVENVLHYRFRDDTGTWGLTESHTFIYMGNDGRTYLDPDDWALLRQAHSMTGGEQWTAAWTFGTTADEPVDLAGVTIDDDGHVTTIDLSGCQLTGPFPYPLLQLPRLHTLVVAGNKLQGDVCHGLADDDTAQALHTLDISANNLSGNIGRLAAHCPQLRSLHAQDNALDSVSPCVSTAVADLRLQQQHIANTYSLHLSQLTADALASLLPPLVAYDHQAQCLAPEAHLLWQTTSGDWAAELRCQGGAVSLTPLSADSWWRHADGDTVMVSTGDGHRQLVRGTTFPMRLCFDPGDANLDGAVDVLDLQTDVNVIMETHGDRLFNYTAANLWPDNTINAQDAVLLVNLLLADDTPHQARHRIGAARQTTAEAEATAYVAQGQLVLNTTRSVAAFDISVSQATALHLSQTLAQQGFACRAQQTSQGTRLIGYSLSGAVLDEGETVLASVEGEQPVVTRVMLADERAEAINVSTATVPTAIRAPGDKGTPARRYDLKGHNASRMSQGGVYIRNGKKAVEERR